MNTVDIVLFDLNSRIKIRTKKLKILKECKIINFKAKMGKNKYKMFERWIEKSQYLKNPYDQNLNRVL